jgi:alpha-tubulin suppressor-like RCC1 family protein
MPGQFLSPEGDLEFYFADEYWLVDQFIGDTLWAWGNNVPDNTQVVRSTARQEFSSSTNWKQVSSGYNHTLAVKTDGTLWAWGSNAYGAIGDNTIGNRSTPRQISTSAGIGINSWKQVSGGRFHSAAIRNDGTLWVWGDNGATQIGDNQGTFLVGRRSVPRQISIAALPPSGLSGWVQVSAGGYHTTAIRNDGTLWAWGLNADGQLGDNTTQPKSTPRQISIADAGGLTGWAQVSAGGFHTAAIRTDGTLWVWGDNSIGQIGDNTNIDRLTPRQISVGITGLNNWRQVSTGNQHTIAINYSGGLWVWGAGASGQIGDNTNIPKSVPTREFTASNNWKYAAGGTSAVRAIKTDGTLWSWGGNGNGQIGDNTQGASRSTPRQELTSGTNWKQVTMGFNHTVAIKAGVELN